MIEVLRVWGVSGITSAELFFNSDFIVITGESGSGKSSLVRAFEFISGRRAHVSLVHSGCDEATVEAQWNVTGRPDEMPLITKRAMSRNGKGRCFVGGGLATAAQLTEASAALIEIQSQFAQLNLLDQSRQLDMVDQCGGMELKRLKERLAETFPAMLAAEREILDIKTRRGELERELENAPARVRQIKSLSLYPGCELEWTKELESIEKRLGDAGRYDDIVSRMDGGESETDLAGTLDALLRDLYTAAPEGLRGKWTELGESALCAIQELFASARAELDTASRDELEARREEVEARIGLLRRVKREAGLRSAEELVSYINEVERDMRWLSESREELEAKQSRAAELRAEAGALARELRSRRETAAADFGEKVNRHLADLAMEDSKFSVAINRLDKVRANGAESASFLLSQSNLSPNLVSKAASGGELSRLLIAMQASVDPSRLPGVIVFDEVEAGLGGRTALLAGKKLKELSKSCRTILITHEATIAAMADQHFLVRRSGEETVVSEIRGEDREREIARMLSGAETTEALDHARALLGAGFDQSA
ncbi:MAG: AAA family ATPase [Synergistaceae bacterium]|jgi:DNA repair protein RecN (Recombination protein N)|nr:AAA family ATPase [Synergistaceae bacterium]